MNDKDIKIAETDSKQHCVKQWSDGGQRESWEALEGSKAAPRTIRRNPTYFPQIEMSTLWEFLGELEWA